MALDAMLRATPEGVVTTLGGGIVSGNLNGRGTARIYGPQGLALDSSGNLSLADILNHAIRKGQLKLRPTIMWAALSLFIFGTALGSTQLNASADDAGTFKYTPAAGTVLEAGT
jgi:hypothetical protein